MTNTTDIETAVSIEDKLFGACNSRTEIRINILDVE